MKLITFFKDKRGVAAVEMAMITPFIVGFALMSVNVWDVGMRKQDELADLRQELSESKKAHREEQARLSAALRRSNARCAQLESERDHLQLRTADLPLRTQGEEDETASVGELDLNKVAALRAKLKNRPGASQE